MNVGKIRKKLGLSKYAMAKKLDVSWNTISFWEKGVWKPNFSNETRIKLLEAGVL